MSLVLDTISISCAGAILVGPLSLTIAAGEIVTIMGASGKGKTSLLNAIAGDLPSPFVATGQVILNGVLLNGVKPEKRGIGRLFQDDFLFPHLTVGENLLFGIARGERTDRVAKMLAALQLIELVGFENRGPHTLSGGQRSRVALMRALLVQPNAMLLDEPFNKLDQNLRTTIRNSTFSHLQTRKIPTLMVTHDASDVPEGGRVIHV